MTEPLLFGEAFFMWNKPDASFIGIKWNSSS